MSWDDSRIENRNVLTYDGLEFSTLIENVTNEFNSFVTAEETCHKELVIILISATTS